MLPGCFILGFSFVLMKIIYFHSTINKKEWHAVYIVHGVKQGTVTSL